MLVIDYIKFRLNKNILITYYVPGTLLSAFDICCLFNPHIGSLGGWSIARSHSLPKVTKFMRNSFRLSVQAARLEHLLLMISSLCSNALKLQLLSRLTISKLILNCSCFLKVTKVTHMQLWDQRYYEIKRQWLLRSSFQTFCIQILILAIILQYFLLILQVFY